MAPLSAGDPASLLPAADGDLPAATRERNGLQRVFAAWVAHRNDRVCVEALQ